MVFLNNLYKNHLNTINGIKFTPREVDIISCIISGKNPQVIANFLSESTKPIELHTVNTHIVNIRRKIDGSSRDSIINFIEKSDKYKFTRLYYLLLLIEIEAINIIKKEIKPIILKENHNIKDITFLLHENFNFKYIDDLYNILKKLFLLLNINVEKLTTTNEILNNNHIIHFGIDDSNINSNILNNDYNIFLTEKNTDNNINNPNILFLEQYHNIYSIFFKTLEKIFPKVLDSLSDKFKEFENKYENIFLENKINDNQEYRNNFEVLRTLPKFTFATNALIVFFIIICFFIGIYVTSSTHKKQYIIRHDLISPIEFSFLNRTKLIEDLKNILPNSKTIQTIAITGPGGAGKTTIAHYYANTQKSDLIWVINASSIESLKESFDQLVDVLCKDEESKKYLDGLRSTINQKNREEKIISLIKDKMSNYDNWILLYDNLNDINEIGKYIPKDSKSWGNGKVIITTRDSHIKDNQYINNTLEIGELDTNEKLELFHKIISPSSLDIKETKEFLELIPPFPLDVSIAAYYLKSTNVSFDEYLKYLNNNNDDFQNVQNYVLKEIGEYHNTRYNIITTSLQSLLETHQDFKDLLIFVSLLNSNNIPRELLYKYKSPIIVDSFIYNLRKYSLVRLQQLPNSMFFISIHKSTQSISLDYIKNKILLEDSKKTIKNIASNLRAYISELTTSENSEKIMSLVSHCEEFLSHKDLLTSEIEYQIRADLGVIYYYLGYDIESNKELNKALLKFEGKKQSIDYAKVLSFLGLTNRRIGNYTEAIKLLEESIYIYQKSDKHSNDLATALGYLGNTYRSNGEYRKSKELLEKSIEIYRSKKEYDSPSYMKALTYLGNIYRLLGNYQKSIDLLQQAMNLYKNNPQNYSGIARNFEYLGMLYNEIGLPEKAKVYIEESLINYEKHYGKNHIQYDSALTFLAIIYNELGEINKSAALLENILKKHIKYYGEDNIKTAFISFHLSRIYYNLGKIEKCKLLLNKSLKQHIKHFGENHIKIANILYFETYANLNKLDLNSAYEKALKCFTIFHKHNHPSQYKALELLSDIAIQKELLYKDPSYKKIAITNLEEALKIAKEFLPTESIYIKNLESKFKKL